MANGAQSSEHLPEEDSTPEVESDSYANGTGKVAADRKVVAKFLISNAAAGSIIGKGGTLIGKGGATIKSFHEDSHATIMVSPQDRQPAGVPDRVVKVTGTHLSHSPVFCMLAGSNPL